METIYTVEEQFVDLDAEHADLLRRVDRADSRYDQWTLNNPYPHPDAEDPSEYWELEEARDALKQWEGVNLRQLECLRLMAYTEILSELSELRTDEPGFLACLYDLQARAHYVMGGIEK